MEFLKGKDLVPYTKAGNLLPLDKVVSIVARVADALGYAHKQNVVHRDIKPANIMYEPESDTVKVTDFGIARITDSSKTKTGMVLGTPSYMSPEQLAGKKIDGRSRPVLAGRDASTRCSRGSCRSRASRWRSSCSRSPTSRTRRSAKYNPALPEWVDAIIDKALAKDFEKRYQTGARVRRGDPRGAQGGAAAAAMPGLDPTVAREPLHRRTIEIHGYKREDGLYDIEGHLVDTKPYDFKLAAGVRARGRADPRHVASHHRRPHAHHRRRGRRDGRDAVRGPLRRRSCPRTASSSAWRSAPAITSA